MAVDFKNKLFQKALWGYVPEEVDEYIAYVAGEYTRLEKRLAAIRSENAKKQGENRTSQQADIPGVTGGAASGDPNGGNMENAFADGERILSEARRNAEQLREEARTDAEKALADAKSGAEKLLSDARADADLIRAEAEKRAADERDAARTEGENLLTDARAEAERLRVEARSEAERMLSDARSEAERLRSEAETSAEVLLENTRKNAEEEAGAVLESARAEAGAIRAAAGREPVPEPPADAEAEEVMQEEARRQFEESGRILTGLRAASARFRSDLAAFSSSMQSLARTQLSAAERFGEDAERFLSEMDAYAGEDEGPEGAEEEEGDLFGFASAAAMLGELLKDLPEEDGGKTPDGETRPDPAEAAADTQSDVSQSEADVLMAESAMAGHIEEEAGRLLAQLLELDEAPGRAPGNAPENAPDNRREETAESGEDLAEERPDDGTDTAPDFSPDETAAIPEEAYPSAAAHPSAAAEPERPDDGEAPVFTFGEQEGGALDAEPGDEELEAVMAALSGISEDDSYDAMLAAFHPEEEVDPRAAEDLAKKRREKFRRMMDEAAGGRSAEKQTGKAWVVSDGAEPKPAPDSGPDLSPADNALEEELTAAVEAALRADLDPAKALDEMLASLTADGAGLGSPGGTEKDPDMPALPTDVMELLDFEEPVGDGPAWTDHSLEEFVSSRDERENGEAADPEDAE